MSDHEMENAGAGDGDTTAGSTATPTLKENLNASRENVDDPDHMIIDNEAPAPAITSPKVNGTTGPSEPKEANGTGTGETEASTLEDGDNKTIEDSESAKPEVSNKQINGEASGPANSHEPRTNRDLSSVSTLTPSTSSKRGPPSLQVEKEIARLQEAVDEVSPEAARHILHKNWRKFLFEDVDDMHVIFVLRALLKNCSYAVMERVSKDGNLFKGNILKAAVKSDAVTSQILGNQEFVDQLCADRIKEVDAKVLLNWLAKGRRLGYSENDIMEVNGWVHPDTHNNASNDVVMMDSHPTSNGFHRPPPQAPPTFRAPPPPNNQPPPPYNPLPSPKHAPQQPLPQQPLPQQAPPQQALPQQPPPPAPQALLPAPGGRMICNHCNRVFDHVSGFNYHHLKKVCTKEPPATGWKWTCEFCFQGFTTKQGREYHNLKGVCETCDIPPTTQIVAASAPQANFQVGTVPSSVPTPPGVPGFAAPFPGPPSAPPGLMAVPLTLPSNTITRPPLHTPVSSQPVVNNPVVASQPINARPGTIQRPPLRTPNTATPLVAGPAPPNIAAIGSNTSSTNGSFTAENSRSGSISGPSPAAHRPFNTPNSGVPNPSTPRSRTPGTRTQTPRTDIRQSPSELPPEKLAQLDSELAAEDSKYEIARQQAESLDEPERTARLTSLKNGLASKKSTIRRRYGVSLRLRERDKLAQRASMSRLRPEDFAQSSVAPASGFSPINTIVTAPTGFSAINATRAAPSPLSDYGSPYLATANSNQPRPSIPAPHGLNSPHPVPGRSSSRLSASSSRRSSEQDTAEGFGVLVRRDSRTTRYMQQNQMTPTTFAAAQKRRRGSQTEDEGAARPSPGPGKQAGSSNGNSYRTPYAPSTSNLSSDSRPGSAGSHPSGSAQAAIKKAKNGKEVATASRNSTPSSTASDTAMGGVPVSAAPGVNDVVPTTEKAPPAKAPQIVELSSDDDSDDEDIPA